MYVQKITRHERVGVGETWEKVDSRKGLDFTGLANHSKEFEFYL